jgi:hypothetical protein
MSNKILFIFEGEKSEDQIVSNLEKVFFIGNTTIKCVYGGEIYQLYKSIKEDEDLDTFTLIKGRNAKNEAILADFKRKDFAEIYLFFDYDGHSSLANDNKLQSLLEFFNEETEKGKLYLSYPMVEALKHICDYETFNELKVECKNNINYKNIVHSSAINELQNYKKYNFDTWKKIIEAHLKKANFVVNETFTLPNKLIPQFVLFSNQLEKYVSRTETIAVLSAFPLFLHDYYGNTEMIQRLT